MRYWCELCREHFPTGHFDDAGDHLAGDDYGPQGALMAERDRYRTALEHIRSGGNSWSRSIAEAALREER